MEDPTTYFFIADRLSPADRDTMIAYPGETDMSVDDTVTHLYWPEKNRAPKPDAPALVRRGADECPSAGELTPEEVTQAQDAYQVLRQRVASANQELLAAEEKFIAAKKRWEAKARAALDEYQPTQDLLAKRLRAYREENQKAVELASLAEETMAAQKRAAEEAKLDAQYGPREFVVMRWTPGNEPNPAYPEAKRAEDLQPLIHLPGCAAVVVNQRPDIEGEPGRTDWNAEPVKALRHGASLERINAVLEAMAQGGYTGYRSSGKVFEYRHLPRRPARLCGRCRAFSRVRERLGEEAWEQWQKDNPQFSYG